MSFSHQIGTRVRLSIMKSISKRQKDKEPTATCSVSAFTARPLLRYFFNAIICLCGTNMLYEISLFSDFKLSFIV